MYLLGRHFKVITDHQPLLHIFNSSTSQASARIDNWRLKLQSFDFEVLYSRGDLNPADYISRHLQAATQCDLIAESAEQYVNFVMTQATLKALSKDDIIKATTQDATHRKWCVLSQMARGTTWSQWMELIQVPLRFLQMFGMNFPQWIVTLSFVEIEL